MSPEGLWAMVPSSRPAPVMSSRTNGTSAALAAVSVCKAYSESLTAEPCVLRPVCLHFPHAKRPRRGGVDGPRHDFFLAQAGVAGVLAGLVFVGVSINLQQVVSEPGSGLPGRTAEALILLVGVLTVFATSTT